MVTRRLFTKLLLGRGLVLAPWPLLAGRYRADSPQTLVRGPKSVFNVRNFGAVGDGWTDDTASIQGAINAAGRSQATVLFPPATYIVTQLHLLAGVTLEGYGATLKRPDATPASPLGKFGRMLTTGQNPWDSELDSPLLVIRGLRVDGNRANQGAYTKYELEHAHLIFLHAATQKAGKLRALLEDVSLVNNVADGLSVYTNCSVQVKNLYASECFRGGLVITGGYTDMQVTGYQERSTVHRYGINIEVDAAGFGNSYAIELDMRDVDISGGFDVGVLPRSRVLGSNIRSGPGFHLYAIGSGFDGSAAASRSVNFTSRRTAWSGPLSSLRTTANLDSKQQSDRRICRYGAGRAI